MASALGLQPYTYEPESEGETEGADTEPVPQLGLQWLFTLETLDMGTAWPEIYGRYTLSLGCPR